MTGGHPEASEWLGSTTMCCAAEMSPDGAKGRRAGHIIAQSARRSAEIATERAGSKAGLKLNTGSSPESPSIAVPGTFLDNWEGPSGKSRSKSKGRGMANGEMRGGWRFRAGFIIFVVSFLSPVLIPLVAASGLSTELKATISGFLAVGIPELGAFMAVAIMGKPGYYEMRRCIFALFKKYGPLKRVSLTRYRIGLIMFAGPILFAWLEPYAEHFIAAFDMRELYVAILGDVIFISSFFVLGGDFWDKVQALFVHGAKAMLPEKPPADQAL